MFTAFSGWNDAGDAATTAVRFIADAWGAETVGTIDPDDFFDFTQLRPTVAIDDNGHRSIDWPTPTLFATTGRAGDVMLDGLETLESSSSPPAIMLIGAEPHNRWRAYCDEVIDIARDLGVTRIIHLGALLAEVPHSRPVPVTASGEGCESPSNRSSRYQGPTGIVGVLHQTCETAGLASTSLWAAVPTYVSGASSPTAALALVRRVATLLSQHISTGLLEISAQSYAGEVSKLVGDDEDTAEYVKRLEHDFDTDPDTAIAPEDELSRVEGLTDEIEQFLREHPH